MVDRLPRRKRAVLWSVEDEACGCAAVLCACFFGARLRCWPHLQVQFSTLQGSREVEVPPEARALALVRGKNRGEPSMHVAVLEGRALLSSCARPPPQTHPYDKDNPPLPPEMETRAVHRCCKDSSRRRYARGLRGTRPKSEPSCPRDGENGRTTSSCSTGYPRYTHTHSSSLCTAAVA